MKNEIQLTIALLLSLFSVGCTTVKSGAPVQVSHSEMPTTLEVEYSEMPPGNWGDLVAKNLEIAEQIISSEEFINELVKRKLSRTNGKSKYEVAHDIQYSGKVKIVINFYYNPDTKAIAYEEDGEIYLNTAKEGMGAGSPGNLAHELAHKLGFTHFTNFRIFGRNSVPYVVGDLVDQLAAR